MGSILIKDTTREEREQIVAESIGNISGSCDHCFKDASKPVKEKEQKRYDALCKGLGL